LKLFDHRDRTNNMNGYRARNGISQRHILLALLAAAVIAPVCAWADASKPIGQIQFTLLANRVVFPVTVNNSPGLDVILDTGMRSRGIYLFHSGHGDHLDPDRLQEVRVGGAGSGEASTAMMADSMTIHADDFSFTNQMVIVSQSGTTQDFPTDGIIGYTLFGEYVVEIDYDDLVIRLYDPEGFSADSTWHRIPIELQKMIPFLEARVSVAGEPPVPIRVYIDLAAGEALEVLVGPSMKLSLPDTLTERKYLGTGLSGDIYGRVGRVERLEIGPFALTDLPADFPPAKVRSKQEGGDGILGNNAIRRFNVIFDYSQSVLYIKRNGHTDEPFE
jgi:hypothetical protein